MVQCSSNLPDKVIILCNDRTSNVCNKSLLSLSRRQITFFPLAVSFIHLMSKQAQLSVVSRRNGTKIRVWLLNNGKVIRGKGCTFGKSVWQSNIQVINQAWQGKQSKKAKVMWKTEKTLEKSYLDALLWVDPSSSCFLLLVFIVVWSG